MLRYGLEALPSPAELEELGEAWKPHRTLACLYLWRSLDAVPANGTFVTTGSGVVYRIAGGAPMYVNDPAQFGPIAPLLVGAGLKRSVSVAFGAVVLVLLIACANVINLLLAKGAQMDRQPAAERVEGVAGGE